jgi:hypothetical protein
MATACWTVRDGRAPIELFGVSVRACCGEPVWCLRGLVEQLLQAKRSTSLKPLALKPACMYTLHVHPWSHTVRFSAANHRPWQISVKLVLTLQMRGRPTSQCKPQATLANKLHQQSSIETNALTCLLLTQAQFPCRWKRQESMTDPHVNGQPRCPRGRCPFGVNRPGLPFWPEFRPAPLEVL